MIWNYNHRMPVRKDVFKINLRVFVFLKAIGKSEVSIIVF